MTFYRKEFNDLSSTLSVVEQYLYFSPYMIEKIKYKYNNSLWQRNNHEQPYIHTHVVSYNKAIASVKANPKIAILGRLIFNVQQSCKYTFCIYSFSKETKFKFINFVN